MTTCPFSTAGCGLSKPCNKCRAAASQRNNRGTTPHYTSKRKRI